jgi:hypothetical protein
VQKSVVVEIFLQGNSLLSLFMNEQLKSDYSKWPTRGQDLIPGVNDTWNEFQKFRVGRSVCPHEWRMARESLRQEYAELIARGLFPMQAAEGERRQSLN